MWNPIRFSLFRYPNFEEYVRGKGRKSCRDYSINIDTITIITTTTAIIIIIIIIIIIYKSQQFSKP